MSGRLGERMMWLGAVLAIGLGTLSWHRQSRALGLPVEAAPLRPAASLPSVGASADAERAVAAIVESNLFRRDRQPPDAGSVAAAQLQAATPQPLAPPKPRLVLRGLVGGPPWNAVVDGIPGRERGIVLRTGDTIAGLTVRGVRAGEVIIRGMDTTWTLKLSRP